MFTWNFPLPHHRAPLSRVQLCLLYSPPWGIYSHGDPPQPSPGRAVSALSLRSYIGCSSPFIIPWSFWTCSLSLGLGSPELDQAEREDHLPHSSRGCLHSLPQGHSGGSHSALCPPAHPGPFLPSRFPAGQSPADTGAWDCSTPGAGGGISLCWPSWGPRQPFLQPGTIPLTPPGVISHSPSLCIISKSPRAYSALPSWSSTGHSSHLQGKPSVPGHQLDSTLLTTTWPGQTLLHPHYLSWWAPHFQEAFHPSFPIRWRGAGSGEPGQKPFNSGPVVYWGGEEEALGVEQQTLNYIIKKKWGY